MSLNWKDLLKEEKKKDYFKSIIDFIENERSKGKIIYPSNADMFNAIKHTTFEDLKVVIIGQDPYHGQGQAHGLSFSVKEGIRQPPSLQNIFKELNSDLGIDIPKSGYLLPWAKQGVLLLNTSLSVEASKPGSHSKINWQTFTDKIISLVNENKEKVVFLLWGAHAKKKSELIDSEKHYILQAPHPSPFSAHSGFFGCKHFSKTNDFLRKNNKKEINWAI
ncbi:UNVERIFIED_CONTAM: hypothetical protein GTU68_013077 [Idotea baltica]|nr:hypothetical protein [Idotea baltica]